MGHCRMDFDVLGAAVGCAEIVRHYGKRCVLWLITSEVLLIISQQDQ